MTFSKTIFGALALGCFLASQANAFTLLLRNDRENPTLGWKKHEVVFDYNPSECPSEGALADLIDQAASVWNAVSTSNLTIKRGSVVSETLREVENSSHGPANPVILCSQNLKSLSQSVLGYADNFIMDGDGVIQFAYLVLNNVTGAKANIFDQDNAVAVTAHEMGHVLGIGHSQDNTALMYYSADAKASDSIVQDDVDAVSYLYASDEPSRGKLLGCGTLTLGAGGKGGGPSGPINLALLFVCCFLWVSQRKLFHRARQTR